MYPDLKDKVAIVTGAGRVEGLGAAIVRRLAREGAKLVIHDIGRTKGDMAPKHGVQVIKAEVPLAEMFGYSTALRSSSQGRATYAMEFSTYHEVPPATAHAIKVRAGVISG